MARKIINAAHRGQHVRLQVGDTLEIHLPENGTTGFTWQLPPHAAWQASRSFKLGGSAPGASGTAIFELRLLRKVAAMPVRLELRRPWESDEAALDEFEFRLSVN